jgi:hypothetical protein
MTAELVRRPAEVVKTSGVDPTGGRLVAWAESMQAAHSLAKALCATSFVPKHFQGKAEDGAAAIMLGDEVGFSPLQALRSIYVVSGTPAMYARAMVALVLAHGHEVWTEKETDDEVTVCGQRRGSDKVERVSWTTARARKAGYTSNKKYETDPRAMLYARASGDVARRIAPDALAGIAYNVEELELEAAPAKRRTVKRAEATVSVVPEPDLEPELEPITAVDPAPDGPMTEQQSKKMHASFNELGITDREQRLAWTIDAIGREISTSSDLTKRDAMRLIDALEEALAKPFEEPSLEGANS